MSFRVPMLAWGMLIYGAGFLVASVLIEFGLFSSPLLIAAPLATAGIMAYVGGRLLRANSVFDILPYSFSWASITLVFDFVFNIRYIGLDYFFEWTVWTTLAAVILCPLLSLLFRSGASTVASRSMRV